MNHRLISLVTVLAFAAVASVASAQDTKVKLEPQNNSNESGTATLTPAGDSTKVVLEVKGAEGTQPTHIHKGTCAQLDPKPAFPLSPVVNGK